VLASRKLILTFSQNVTPGTGNLTLRNLTNGSEEILPASDPRLTYDQNVVKSDPAGLIGWNKSYAIRLDAGVFLGDGVDNGLAFMLGAANLNVDATSLLPAVSHSGGNLVLTFSMLNAASRGTAALNVQHNSVTATISTSEFVSGKLFGRVIATE
jgi:hypothetical protein